MKTFPCFFACSALLTATAIAPAALAQDPAIPAASPGYGAPPAAGYYAPAYGAPAANFPPGYGPAAGYSAPDWSPRPWAYRDDEGTERRSPAMMITGFSMMGVGVGGVVTGALVFMVSQSIQYEAVDYCVQAPCYSSPRPPSSGAVGGVAAMVSGGLLVAVGLPLGIVGAMRKPREDTASPVPQVSIGPTGGRLRWTF